MKKLIAMAICLVSLFSLAGCADDLVYDTSLPQPEVTTTKVTTTAEPIEEEPTREAPVYSETVIDKTDYDLEIFSYVAECEKGTVRGIAYIDQSIGGYSGEGYVRGVSYPDSGLLVSVDIPSSQHYSVTLCAYCDLQMSGILYIDGVAKGEFVLGGSGGYECVMFDNVYLAEGEVTFSFAELTSDAFFDYIKIDNCIGGYTQTYNFTGELSNAKANEQTKALYRYICECFGDEILTAQAVTPGTNKELDKIYYTTGKYPAIRFSDMMDYTVGIDNTDVELAIEWAGKGGIVGYNWYWVKDGSCYFAKNGFDITKCINDHDVARLNEKRFTELYQAGGISDETMSLLGDIDRIAKQLTRLKEAGVTVLFRPLPQASSGEFWWGVDKDAYLWLWELVYARLSDYWQLDNLIWIWSAQSRDWYVGDDWCDIISLDIYDFSGKSWDNQSHINQLLNAADMCNHKPIAISECNILPSPALLSRDNAYWSFVCMWNDYALDRSGELNYKYLSEAEWIMFYNCSLTQTLEELDRTY